MKLRTEIFNSIDTIPKAYWDCLGCTHNIYYSPEFLNAFEQGNPTIDFNYVVITRGKEAIAFANTQCVTISIKTITKNIKLPQWIKTILNRLFCNSHVKVLFCGNVFLSGEYGTFLKTGEDKIDTFNALAKGIKTVSKRTKRLHALFVKDFVDESLYITNTLSQIGYTPLHVEPNMLLHLNSKWQTFEDYIAALKSKYRVKVNRADTKSKDLEVKRFTKADLVYYENELQQLYQNTIKNANFNAQVLNLKTYSLLKSIYKEAFYVQGYFLNGDLVGFLSAMKHNSHLDAHFIGIDYSKNKAYAIYTRILNDYVRLGIQTKSKYINLGRTASEIKSTLGAIPQPLTCYFKHKRKLPNRILKPFIKNVQIKTFKQHQPFK